MAPLVTADEPADVTPGPIAHPLHGHIVVCGLEALGVRSLEELQRLGERCVVITRHVQPRYRDAVRSLVEAIVEGDPRDPDVLREAAVERARAIVLTDDDDVANIHVALTAGRLRPGIHVVMRTFDEDFARHVETLLPDVVAMSSSALAAPGFVTALLDKDAEERWIEVLGRTLVLRRAAADDQAVLVPLADDSRDPVELFPRHGQRLLCLVDAAGTPAHTQSARPAGRGTALPRTGSISWLRRVDRRFWVLGGVLALITLGSALVFVSAAGLDLVEAVYDTVGAFFGGVDPSVASGTSLKLFAILLTLIGAAALAVFYGLIADIVLSARIGDLLGPQATDARDHVIVVGLGSIGYRVALLVRARGVEVVAAERQADGRFVEAARSQHIPVVTTDARDQQALIGLRVDRARAILVCTDDDAANLATAMHARALRPDLRVVVRLFDPDLAAQLDRALGGYNSRSVSALAAPAFAAAAVGRQVLATVPVGTRRLLIVARVPVEAGSAAEGSTVTAEEAAGSRVELGGCRVLALVVGDEVRWDPAPGDTVAAGTELVVVATRRGLAAVVQRGTAHRAHPAAIAAISDAVDS